MLDISVVNDASGISVTIEANGKGFIPGTNADGLGLKNIKSHVQYFYKVM